MLDELSLESPEALLEPSVLVKPELLESSVAVTGVVDEDVAVPLGEAVVEDDADVDVDVDVGSSTSLTQSPASPPPAASG